MPRTPYIMKDQVRHQVDHIMEFNVALRRDRPRSVIELGIFSIATLTYLISLALAG